MLRFHTFKFIYFKKRTFPVILVTKYTHALAFKKNLPGLDSLSVAALKTSFITIHLQYFIMIFALMPHTVSLHFSFQCHAFPDSPPANVCHILFIFITFVKISIYFLLLVIFFEGKYQSVPWSEDVSREKTIAKERKKNTLCVPSS